MILFDGKLVIYFRKSTVVNLLNLHVFTIATH